MIIEKRWLVLKVLEENEGFKELKVRASFWSLIQMGMDLQIGLK